jgi:pSer/pThr/pTyr-binding forkhead associated (FHA) protein
LRESSRGWPGLLNQRATEVLERMTELQSVQAPPRIIVTRDGHTLDVQELTERKYVIGRNELADISLEDPYVSKTHAMLQVVGGAIILVDLNSTNGTLVNSKMVLKRVLRNNDIISLGRYRLKIENVPALDEELDRRIKMTDTITLQDIADLRRKRAQRQVKSIKNR